MTSPRTPRQWNAGDPEPPADVKELRDAKGNRMLRLERGRWRFAPFTLNTKPWAAKRDYPKWTKLDDHFWMEWPLSEVLPETPEPPRPECECFVVPEEQWTRHYDATEPGSMLEPNPDCQVHFPAPQSVPAETERPQRCAVLTPEGDLVTEGRQCQQYEGHAHDHTWYGDNGHAYSAWRVTS